MSYFVYCAEDIAYIRVQIINEYRLVLLIMTSMNESTK